MVCDGTSHVWGTSALNLRPYFLTVRFPGSLALLDGPMQTSQPYVPSVARVLRTDYWSFLLVFGHLFAPLLAVATPLVGVPVLLLLLILTVARVRAIRRTFATGATTQAVIVGRAFSRGLWTAAYEIEVEGRKLKVRDDYLSFKMPIEIGDRYPAVFDPKQPDRAYLRPFFQPEHERDRP